MDTTVRKKNITYPTDSKLLYKALVKLGDAAESRGIVIRQSYIGVGKKAATLAATENVTGVAVTDAHVDKGYRGHGYAGGVEIHIAGQRRKNTTRAERKRRRHGSAIEPKIGHLKSDHRMGRCFPARLCGDAINATPAAAGSNLRKLLGLLRN